MPSLNNAVSNLKNEFLRADSEMEGSVNGFSTPPPGTLTPLGVNGVSKNGVHGSQADISEADGTGVSVNGYAMEEDADLDDLEYKTWKQVTKKDRATIAAERHRLFRDDHLQPDEPAVLRTKAGMRRWLRHRKQAMEEESASGATLTTDGKDGISATAGESLAEGIEGEDERQVPDYYDAVCSIPDLVERLQWVEDAEGHVIQQAEEYMRIVPPGQFTSPDGALTKKMDSNIQALQDTRKICAKIGIVKQMQIQSQVSEKFNRGNLGQLLNCTSCIRISSKDTNLSRSWKRILSQWSFPRTLQSWLLSFAVLPFNEALARSSIMLVSKSFNLPLSMRSPTSPQSSSRILSPVLEFIAKPQR